ncbi:hypothetical protein [Pseudomonas graminis]
MTFTEVKKQAINCLRQDAYDHEVRRDLDVKNLFATGVVDKVWVAELIKKPVGRDIIAARIIVPLTWMFISVAAGNAAAGGTLNFILWNLI